MNTRSIEAVLLTGGKSLYGTNFTPHGVKFDANTTVNGLRFKTRVEGRQFTAFVPFSAVIGVIGKTEGEPTAEPNITFDPAGLGGLYIVGGRLLRLRSAELVESPFGGPALAVTILSDMGREEAATLAISEVIAFLGDFRTDYEREEEEQEVTQRESHQSLMTRGTDSATYAAAMSAQTTVDKKTGKVTRLCAACHRPLPEPGYSIPVYVAGLGIVHRNLPCNKFSRQGLLAHNEAARG